MALYDEDGLLLGRILKHVQLKELKIIDQLRPLVTQLFRRILGLLHLYCQILFDQLDCLGFERSVLELEVVVLPYTTVTDIDALRTFHSDRLQCSSTLTKGVTRSLKQIHRGLRHKIQQLVRTVQIFRVPLEALQIYRKLRGPRNPATFDDVDLVHVLRVSGLHCHIETANHRREGVLGHSTLQPPGTSPAPPLGTEGSEVLAAHQPRKGPPEGASGTWFRGTGCRAPVAEAARG